jgi:hypothetical protein
MFRARWWWRALTIGLVAGPVLLAGGAAAAAARPMSVDIWTDRGKDAIYEPNDPIEIKVRASDDAYLLVYDIDSEGAVRVLYPYAGSTGYIAGGHTYHVPPTGSGLQLVVQGPTGQGFVVAIVSREPFNPLPSYLRPYDPQADNAGYVGEDEDDNDADVTADGRISGDPFVAMEHIRRKVLYRSDDTEAFGTAYTAYYIHEAVRYPRYLCNDCHRPGQWAWWDGWDPYYASCTAFDFRVYWGWSWGPRYWFGTVPYFCYVPRCYPCAPYDRPYYTSWGGGGQWRGLWGGPLVRYKSPPPRDYHPPASPRWSTWQGEKPLPPGFMRSEKIRGGDGREVRVPVGANRPWTGSNRQGLPGDGQRVSRPGAPAGRDYRRQDRPRGVEIAPRGGDRGAGGDAGVYRRQDRPRGVEIAPRGTYRGPGSGGAGRYAPAPNRGAAPRVVNGGGSGSSERPSSPAPSRQERSDGDSRPAPSGHSGSSSSSPSSGGGHGDAGGERPRR